MSLWSQHILKHFALSKCSGCCYPYNNFNFEKCWWTKLTNYEQYTISVFLKHLQDRLTSGMDLLLEIKWSNILSFKTFFVFITSKLTKENKISSCSSSQLDRNRDRNSVYTYKVYGKAIKKAVCAKKLKGINNFLTLCSFLYFIEI